MVLSDYARLRPQARPSWLGVVVSVPFSSQLLASLFLRGQQHLVRKGHIRAAWAARTLCGCVTGADFVPGADVGLGVMLTHPVGVVIGSGTRIGNNVTFAGGVTLGVKSYDHRDPRTGSEDYPVIGDGVFLGSHAVVLGSVRVGDNAVIGANSVVSSDVDAEAIVSGIPAKVIGYRTAPDHSVAEQP
jgi:serine O-acetyltransferase